MNINYFGKPYSFTHVVSLRRFGSEHKYIPIPTINKTIDAALTIENSISVVPIENTMGGFVYNTIDALTLENFLNSPLQILEELEFLINLFLLSKNKIKLSQIKKIYSHEYALKNSEQWIKKHINPDVQLIQVTSTSEATQQIQKEKYSCAIASSEAANYYKLKKLEVITIEGKKNLTKFFVIGLKQI